MRVTVLQFLKNRPSSEVAMLEKLGAKVLRGQANDKFVFQMNDAEREETARIHAENFRRAAESGCELLVLDEALSAVSVGVFSQEALVAFLKGKPPAMEVVLTEMCIRDRPETAEAAWALCQKRQNVVMAGNMWLRMQKKAVGMVIDLSGLGLDYVKEEKDAFELGAMASLRTLETDARLQNEYFGTFSHALSPINVKII